MIIQAFVALALFTSPDQLDCQRPQVKTAVIAALRGHGASDPLKFERNSDQPPDDAFVAKTFKVNDAKNGYAELEHRDLAGAYRAAVFKAPGGFVLVITVARGSETGFTAFRCKEGLMEPDYSAIDISPDRTVELYEKAGLLKPEVVAKTQVDRGMVHSNVPSFRLEVPRKGRSIAVFPNYDVKDVWDKQIGAIELDGDVFKVRSM